MNGSTEKSWIVRATILALTASLAACTDGGSSVGGSSQPVASGTPVASASAAATPAPSVSVAPVASGGISPEATPNVIALKVYYVMVGDRQDSPTPLVAVNRDVPRTATVATTAMHALLEGPTFEERTHNLRLGTVGTLIPVGTRLLGLDVDGGNATVDLSGEFASGAALGVDVSEAWAWRLAQVTYTLTQFPTVESVSFRVDGKPTQAIEGHEGTPHDRATRAMYFDQLPGIFIDQPAWGAAVTDPLMVSGIAQIDAAQPQFEVALVKAATDEIVVQQTVRAECNEGCWPPPGGGEFEIRISIPEGVDRGGLLLRVWEDGPGGGDNFREYPLR